MPPQVVPARDNVFYVEWRKWRHGTSDDNVAFRMMAWTVLESLNKVAVSLYPDHPCIVGHMIMMDDQQTSEERSAA